jgi:hypothetical protein
MLPDHLLVEVAPKEPLPEVPYTEELSPEVLYLEQ